MREVFLGGLWRPRPRHSPRAPPCPMRALAAMALAAMAAAAPGPPVVVRLRSGAVGPPGASTAGRSLAEAGPADPPPPLPDVGDARWGPLIGADQVVVAVAAGRADAARAAVAAVGGLMEAALPDAGLLCIVPDGQLAALAASEGGVGGGRGAAARGSTPAPRPR